MEFDVISDGEHWGAGVQPLVKAPTLPDSEVEDVLVQREAFLPMSVEQLADRFPSRDETTGASRWGLRYLLTNEEGTGYWDNFRPLQHTVLSIVHTTYKTRAWVPLHGEGLFKLRLLLSGRLLDAKGDLLLEGPAASLSIHPRGKDSGYFIAPGIESKLVILHCHPDTLSSTMRLPEHDIPAELASAAVSNSASARFRKLSLGPRVFDAALDMIRSRYEYCGSLRMNFLEAKCKEILCSVVNDLQTAELERKVGERLTARDLNRVLEARDYLANNFRSPPSIPALARRVGVNQTKLKQNFRQAMGTTLHAFVQDIRMRKASEMLLGGECTIAEVSYAVGYDHAANFTYAFKKYYGFVPRALKPKR